MPPRNSQTKQPTALAPAQTPVGALTVPQLLAQVALIQHIMATAMKPGEHFGKVPGCGDKDTLFKAGAEKLCLVFRMAPSYQIDERDLDRGHREYRIQCSLSSIPTTTFLGQGVGVCSTMEGKYRFRGVAAEATDRPVPRAYWDLRQDDPAKAQELLGGKGFTPKKVEGKGWMIAKGGEKLETDNPADGFNTVLKMAKKRALVDAVLTATAASDIFTQDLDDIEANLAATNEAIASAVERNGATRPTFHPSGPIHGGDDARATGGEGIDDEPAKDFREVRIHIGKNRGLMLCELSPHQVHELETEWKPDKLATSDISDEDRTLLDALTRYREWRGGQGTRRS